MKKMSFLTVRLFGAALILSVLTVPALFAGGSKEAGKAETAVGSALDQWLSQAEMGKYQPEREDWEAILAKAKAEPPLTLYTETGRSFKMLEAFEKTYGIKVEGINLRGTDLFLLHQ